MACCILNILRLYTYVLFDSHRVQDHFKIIWLLSWRSKGLPNPPPLQCHLGPNPTPGNFRLLKGSLRFIRNAKVGSWKSSPLPVPRWQLETICFFFDFGTPNVFGGEMRSKIWLAHIFFQVDGSTTQVLCYLFFIAVYLTDVLCTDEPGLISMKSSWNWYPIDGLFLTIQSRW